MAIVYFCAMDEMVKRLRGGPYPYRISVPIVRVPFSA